MIHKVKIKLYTEEHEIDIEEDEVILTAALGKGLEPPFSCQIGACASCKALLKSGEVRSDWNDALTDDEIAQGFILTCQSHPLTDDVSIDYDY